eukprot:Trichotokara_eunicae@DN1850_c0_g1_i2.p1
MRKTMRSCGLGTAETKIDEEIFLVLSLPGGELPTTAGLLTVGDVVGSVGAQEVLNLTSSILDHEDPRKPSRRIQSLANRLKMATTVYLGTSRSIQTLPRTDLETIASCAFSLDFGKFLRIISHPMDGLVPDSFYESKEKIFQILQKEKLRNVPVRIIFESQQIL